MKKEYRVWLVSVPGMYAQYDGYVDVYATNEEQAKKNAFIKLKNTSFPDRNSSMWRVTKVEPK